MNIWFCCVDVSFSENNEHFPGDTGAFVNAITQAKDKQDCISKIDLSNVTEKAIAELKTESYFMRIAAHNTLKFMGRISADVANEILAKVNHFKNAANVEEKELYDSLSFEFAEIIINSIKYLT